MTTTYSAETVAELALELRTVSRLSWALHEQNAQFKTQLESQASQINLLKLQRDVLQSAVRTLDRQLEDKALKIQRLLTMETTPVSVLKLAPGPMRALQRLRCKTIADVTRLNKANMKNNKGYRLIFEAMAEYLEGRS